MEKELTARDIYLQAKTQYSLVLGRNEIPLAIISAGDENPIITTATVQMPEPVSPWAANNVLDMLGPSTIDDVIGMWRSYPMEKMIISLVGDASFQTRSQLARHFGDDLIIEFDGWPDDTTGLVTVYTNPGFTEKHLAGKHDQKKHGRVATGREITSGKKKAVSSLEPKLRGKEFEGQIIRHVRNTGSDKKERLVIFKNGSGLFIPVPVLLKMAFGIGEKGEAGRMFKTLRKLRQNGFVSWAQANYLYAEKQDVFWTILEAAQEGRRVWNSKTRHMDLFDQDLDTEID